MGSELPEDRSQVCNQCFHPRLIACAANTTGIANKEQEAQQASGILLQDWLSLAFVENFVISARFNEGRVLLAFSLILFP